MGNSDTDIIREFDRLIRRDPGKRGLIDSEARFGPLCHDHLLNAAIALTQNSSQVVITTGFYVPSAEIPAAETDGPPGAILLALVLEACGINTSIITDELCAPVVSAAVDASAYPASQFEVLSNGQEDWVESFFSRRSLSHLISIERVGPSHTPDSWQRQQRSSEVGDAAFHQKVSQEHYDRCHNMRGEIIDAFTPPLHQLFERLPEFFPDAQTIGVGDGGNEIGMGAISWEELDRRIASEYSALIPCRIATDWNIVAGTSNWGAAALAAAVALLHQQTDVLFAWQRDEQQQVLEAMVREANAVDGVTKLREATVDGLPFLTYMQPWEGILQILTR
ncbi:MAG: glutamate cyclase domain-containing protein [Planctomycetota bacterium]